jgi:iron complex outermembrane recepter protein
MSRQAARRVSRPSAIAISFRFGSALPNPDLEAETSTNYEIGFARDLGRVQYGAAVFLSQIEDAIQSVSIDDSLCTSPPCSQPEHRGTGQQGHRGCTSMFR